MKTSTKIITREQFVLAINSATLAMKTKHHRTKLAYYCQEFLELNKKLKKAHDKKQHVITKTLTNDLRNFRIQQAVEKDGHLVYNSANNGYMYSKIGEQAVLDKQDDINEKLSEVLEPFLEEEIEVTCIVDPLKLPDNIDYDTEKNLNGFVFQNKNEFEEKNE